MNHEGLPNNEEQTTAEQAIFNELKARQNDRLKDCGVADATLSSFDPESQQELTAGQFRVKVARTVNADNYETLWLCPYTTIPTLGAVLPEIICDRDIDGTIATFNPRYTSEQIQVVVECVEELKGMVADGTLPHMDDRDFELHF
jgi:hypothetical protein